MLPSNEDHAGEWSRRSILAFICALCDMAMLGVAAGLASRTGASNFPFGVGLLGISFMAASFILAIMALAERRRDRVPRRGVVLAFAALAIVSFQVLLAGIFPLVMAILS